MLNERQHAILKILEHEGDTSVRKLSELLEVSSVTIRQDLNDLEGEGLLKRVHGGAVLNDADDLASRLGINFEKKLRIAKKVSSCIREGETILIESGSVNVLLARALDRFRKLTILTTNVYIAQQFRKSEHTHIILLGGVYQHESETLVGSLTKSCIDQININKAFIGIDGYTTRTGFTLRDLFRAEISTHIIHKAEDVFIVTDSSKFGKHELARICDKSQVDHIATDRELDPIYKTEFLDSGIDLILS